MAHRRLSDELQRFFFEEEREPQVKLADILGLAGERILGFLFVIISLPSALPVPAPGYSTPFGIVIFLLAVQLVVGSEQPWLPQRVRNYKLELEQAQRIVKKGIPWLRRIEAVARPRLDYVCASGPGRIVIGAIIALMSLSMMIAIPGTNTLPAIGVFVTGFGLLEEDGAISLAGLVLCVIGASLSISILVAIVWGGSNLVDLVKEWIGNL
ncbi:MAG: hypothetical protein BRC38_00680 [Cyanobacteria bacterium QH_6_48_35]|jgi:hypothetical protein|nr:MAG: hypothetical protein BRC34_17195 [Cyanobacteria bacterium QH_1_48_107]PSO53774.1 MAG: hypothetical protein BRC35_15380 [Cyanobacteria bacterium QH_10_48_56]PSO60743.1 MAG: hypothetical protein BRC39_09270 [Cyanobacteria bacterium QH_7_48_89]PSO66160.1 MAG: hypothetical protein BRC36_01965 [Cyanobacteria bacterium QH_2_48_84]PSO68969.1 MAG: hypothetical protein BRC38_00680 [Cyanobacteria bacterium QH_6_48_35]PSP35200.1 MAG: hypothetical protein BRC57_08485 [Cyanobacteria bacterium QS_8_